MRRGLSVRWRLTLVYTLISRASGAVLLGVIYALVSHPRMALRGASGPPGDVVGRGRVPSTPVAATASRGTSSRRASTGC